MELFRFKLFVKKILATNFLSVEFFVILWNNDMFIAELNLTHCSAVFSSSIYRTILHTLKATSLSMFFRKYTVGWE